jgi:hypothetical protein
MGFGPLLGRLGWGLGAALLAGGGLIYSKEGRPLLRGALVTFLAVSERLTELAGETRERFEDVLAEAQAEYATLATDGSDQPTEVHSRPSNGVATHSEAISKASVREG